MPGRILRWAYAVVEALIALSAIGGGVALATGVDEFPPGWLRHTPFDSYLVPGLILTVAVGGSAAVAAVTAARRHAAGRLASLVAGVIMMGWIAGEVLLVTDRDARSWLEAGYFGAGMVMVAFGLVAARPIAARPIAARPAAARRLVARRLVAGHGEGAIPPTG